MCALQSIWLKHEVTILKCKQIRIQSRTNPCRGENKSKLSREQIRIIMGTNARDAGKESSWSIP